MFDASPMTFHYKSRWEEVRFPFLLVLSRNCISHQIDSLRSPSDRLNTHDMSHDSSCMSLWYHLVDKGATVEWPHLGKVLPPQTGFMNPLHLSSSISFFANGGRSWKNGPGWPLYRRRRSAVCASCNFSRGCCGWTRIFDGLQSRPAMDPFATCRWWDFPFPPKRDTENLATNSRLLKYDMIENKLINKLILMIR